MTTAHTNITQPQSRFRLPDPPQREPDETTQFDQLTKTGNARYLAIRLGNPDTTLVEADRWMIAHPSDDRTRARRPDLMVAFDVDPTVYEESNGYIVSEQGKPPDFVLEVASESTAETDVGANRDDYAALGILEYWRFDKTGEFHGVKLAGDRLIDGAYQPIPIDELDDGSLEGHSAALNLNIRWGGASWSFTTLPPGGASLLLKMSGPTRTASTRLVSPPKLASARWNSDSSNGTPDKETYCYLADRRNVRISFAAAGRFLGLFLQDPVLTKDEIKGLSAACWSHIPRRPRSDPPS